MPPLSWLHGDVSCTSQNCPSAEVMRVTAPIRNPVSATKTEMARAICALFILDSRSLFRTFCGPLTSPSTAGHHDEGCADHHDLSARLSVTWSGTGAAKAVPYLVGDADASQEPTAVAPRRPMTMRPEIVGQRGIVAGGRHYSVHAGRGRRSRRRSC